MCDPVTRGLATVRSLLACFGAVIDRAEPFDEGRADAWLVERAEALAELEAEVDVAESLDDTTAAFLTFARSTRPSAPHAAGAEKRGGGECAHLPTAAPSSVRTSAVAPRTADSDLEMGVPPAPVSGVADPSILAIKAVLACHQPCETMTGHGFTRGVACIDVNDHVHVELADWQDGRDHVAPLIAQRITQK